MDVAEVVDEETEGVGLGDVGVARVESVVNVVIDVGVKVISAVLLADPGRDLGDSFGDVAGGDFGGLGIVGCSLTILIDEGIINKVEVTLPATTMVLNIVREGRALNERVHVLTVDKLRVKVLQILELGESRIECGLVFLLKDIHGHVSDCHVSVDGKGADCVCQKDDSLLHIQIDNKEY